MEAREHVVDLLNRMTAEPLAHMMTSHRELFHSNMLAWFFTFFPRAADRVFGAMAIDGSPDANHRRQVLRESDNIDLVFEWPDRASVLIENKTFSIPSEEQLYRYGEKQDANTNCWLLSLIDPVWPYDQKTIGSKTWRLKRYSDLAREIADAVQTEPHSFEREVAVRYAALVSNLSALTGLMVSTSDDEAVEPDQYLLSAISGTRFSSGLNKVRAASIMKAVAAALPQTSLVAHPDMNYTDGPLLECFYDIPAEPQLQVGWQLQNKQFRLALKSTAQIYQDGEPTQQGQALANRYRAHFDFSGLDPILGTSAQSEYPLKRAMNGYSPNFVYRYKKTANLSVAQLKAAAGEVATRVQKLWA